MTKTNKDKEHLKIVVHKGKVLGIEVYRGYARLCDLAMISKADIFDQKSNPFGTQRDLSPKHAKDAYIYVKENELAFWPEVFLCVRDAKILTYTRNKHNHSFGTIKLDYQQIISSSDILISRIDGNHRLHYAGGNIHGFPPITKEVSFCIAYNLSSKEEIMLFRDINNNQKRMNTSHLDNIESRLTPIEIQKSINPSLFISKKLGEDQDSILFEKVYEGGKKPGYFAIPLRSLKSGIQYMLSQPGKLTELPTADVQYEVIKNYFSAIKNWQPEAWSNPNKYIVFRGAGLWAICFIGSTVIDKTLSLGKYNSSDMLKILKSGPNWDWSNSGDFAGYSGRGGATKIRDIVIREFPDESGISIQALAEKILKGNIVQKF